MKRYLSIDYGLLYLNALVSWCVVDVAPGHLQQPSAVGPAKPDRGSYGSLMSKLMRQRPKGVSHLLQDNLPRCMLVTFVVLLTQTPSSDCFAVI